MYMYFECFISAYVQQIVACGLRKEREFSVVITEQLIVNMVLTLTAHMN